MRMPINFIEQEKQYVKKQVWTLIEEYLEALFLAL